MQAAAARDRVKVKYVNVRKPILTLEEAIEQESFYPVIETANVQCGDANRESQIYLCGSCEEVCKIITPCYVTGALETSDVVVEGAVEVGEQYPMHMENNICLVVPQEGFYIAYSSTQSIADVTAATIAVLGVKASWYVA